MRTKLNKMADKLYAPFDNWKILQMNPGQLINRFLIFWGTCGLLKVFIFSDTHPSLEYLWIFILGLILILAVSNIVSTKCRRTLEQFLERESLRCKICINGYIITDIHKENLNVIDYSDVLIDEDSNTILLHTYKGVEYRPENTQGTVTERRIEDYYSKFGKPREYLKLTDKSNGGNSK